MIIIIALAMQTIIKKGLKIFFSMIITITFNAINNVIIIKY